MVTNHTDELLKRLSDGVTQLTTSENWKAWLSAQSRFHKYSFSNTLLILAQRPHALRVAGFRTWCGLGRQVRSGEKAIWILAPTTHRRAADADDEEAQVFVTGFRAVPVFDIAQTDGPDLPAVCKPLEGDDPAATYARLVPVAKAFGFTVEDYDFTGSTNGDCDLERRRIRIRAGNSPAQRVKTLVHELGHSQLHESSTLDRPLKELEAESVAFVVCSALGLTTDAYSFGYVAIWAGGGDEAIAGIKASASRIQRASLAILDSIERTTPGDGDRAVPVFQQLD